MVRPGLLAGGEVRFGLWFRRSCKAKINSVERHASVPSSWRSCSLWVRGGGQAECGG